MKKEKIYTIKPRDKRGHKEIKNMCIISKKLHYLTFFIYFHCFVETKLHNESERGRERERENTNGGH